jgi:hypothetical protein
MRWHWHIHCQVGWAGALYVLCISLQRTHVWARFAPNNYLLAKMCHMPSYGWLEPLWCGDWKLNFSTLVSIPYIILEPTMGVILFNTGFKSDPTKVFLSIVLVTTGWNITFLTNTGRVPWPPSTCNKQEKRKIEMWSPHLSDPCRSWQIPSSHQLQHEQLWDQAQGNASHIQIEFKWFPSIGGFVSFC